GVSAGTVCEVITVRGLSLPGFAEQWSQFRAEFEARRDLLREWTGGPSYAVASQHLPRSLYLASQGFFGFWEGVSFLNPHVSLGVLDQQEVGVAEAMKIGAITRNIELTLPLSTSAALFGRGTWLNTGRYWQLGHSTHQNVRYFSLRSPILDRIVGKRVHIDLWSFGRGK
ncbi:MAG: hypothetical protein L0312_32950, partial [Acidobacteria bacterium]|nr:hypothetical protein [Acidobacteriota bacterium]